MTRTSLAHQRVRFGAHPLVISRTVRHAAVLLMLAAMACVPPVPVSPAVEATAVGQRLWVVEPGDVLRLRTWLTTDQSGDLPVNENGEVLIPTVGRLKVGGMKPDVVEATVVKAYNERIDSTRVQVTFLRPVAVLGGVKSPGVQLADPSASVLSLVSRAGGPTRAGGNLHVYLLRVGEPAREISAADMVADLGVRGTDQIYVKDPSFIVRNESAVRAAYETLQVLAAVLTLIVLLRQR